MDVTLGAALLAGLLSFLSPCVLPVVPAYLGQLGIVAAARPAGFGTTSLASVGEVAVDGGFSPAPSPIQARAGGWRAMPNAFAFVLGFTVVFTGVGILIYQAASPLREHHVVLHRGVLRLAHLLDEPEEIAVALAEQLVQGAPLQDGDIIILAAINPQSASWDTPGVAAFRFRKPLLPAGQA